MSEIVTEIHLAAVPITPENQIDFDGMASQYQWFTAHQIASFPNCSFQTHTGSVRVNGFVERYMTSINYIFFQNSANGKYKTYYGYVTEMEAVAKEVTEIFFTIDPYQTFMFDMLLHECFIEREHVTNDRPGLHTLPEGLQVSDYVCAGRKPITQLTGTTCKVLAIADPSENYGLGFQFGKSFSGLQYEIFEPSKYGNLALRIGNLSGDGKGDSIAYIFNYPYSMAKKLVPTISSSADSGEVVANTASIMNEETISINPNELNYSSFWRWQNDTTYIPKNNKLYCYPYSFLTVTTPDGGNVVLKYELFNHGIGVMPGNATLEFKLYGTMCPNSPWELVPQDYDGKNESYEDACTLTGFPLCSWANDTYANWYAQHTHSISAQSTNAKISYNAGNAVNKNSYDNSIKNAGLSKQSTYVNAIPGVVGNLLSGNLGGALTTGLMSGYNANMAYTQAKNNADTSYNNSALMNNVNYHSTIRSIMASMEDVAVQPNTSKGDTSGSGIDLERGTHTFFINAMQVKPETAEIIDMYFQMFGYQVNRVAYPRTNTRLNWNYIKTANCQVTGNVPKVYRQQIAEMYNTGFTVWHSENAMYHYGMENPLKEN